MGQTWNENIDPGGRKTRNHLGITEATMSQDSTST